jgi:hypothetical protein
MYKFDPKEIGELYVGQTDCLGVKDLMFWQKGISWIRSRLESNG